MKAPLSLTQKRQMTHGDWADTALNAHRLKDALTMAIEDREGRGQTPLHPPQFEALEMILAKIARIVSGDPNHADHWVDIAGYAALACGLDLEAAWNHFLVFEVAQR